MFLLHMAGDIVHRTVAVDEVKLNEWGVLHLHQGAVAGPLRHYAQPHLFQQNARGPGVAADVVIANDGNIIRGAGKRLPFAIVQHPVAHHVVGNMVSQRLRYAAKAFAAHRDHRFIQRLAAGVGHGADVIADQAHRALRLDGDPFGQREQQLHLFDQFGQLFIAAENNIALLKIRGEVQGAEAVDTADAGIVVAPSGARILAAADGAVRDMGHIFDWPKHHPFRARIGAATHGHHPGLRFTVRDNALADALHLRIADHHVLSALFARGFGKHLQDFLDERKVTFACCVGHGEDPVLRPRFLQRRFYQ